MSLLVPASGLMIMLGVLYIPVLRDLVRLWWTDPNYSHGFLIPFIAGYLVWSRKHTLGKIVPQPSGWGGLILGFGLCLLLMGHAVEMAGGLRGALFVKGLSLVMVLTSMVVLLLGRQALTILAFPMAYSVFMIPLPDDVLMIVTLPLQTYATRVTTSLLHLFGIPALREGNLIHLPFVTLGVIEACSGVRSLLTLMAWAIALGALMLKPGWPRCLLVGSVVPIAVVTNALRVTGTGLLAHYGGADLARGFFHGFSGWAIPLVATVLLGIEILFLANLPADREDKRLT